MQKWVWQHAPGMDGSRAHPGANPGDPSHDAQWFPIPNYPLPVNPPVWNPRPRAEHEYRLQARVFPLGAPQCASLRGLAYGFDG